MSNQPVILTKANVSEEGMIKVVTYTPISVSQISLLMEKSGLSVLLVRVSCQLKYGAKETKMYIRTEQCFPNMFVRAPLLASKNKHRSSHLCSRKYRVCGW
jgi:hypothetical protein